MGGGTVPGRWAEGRSEDVSGDTARQDDKGPLSAGGSRLGEGVFPWGNFFFKFLIWILAREMEMDK